MSARRGSPAARARRDARRAADRTIRPTTPAPYKRGRAQQKIGMWGTLSTDYRTPATHDPRWSRTVSDR